MEQYLIDTNAVSHYLSAMLTQPGIDFMDDVINATPNLSVISQIELLSWKTLKSSQISDFINDSLIFNITPEVVAICVSIRKSRKIKTPDAIIAATAIANNLTLVTDNEKDFEHITKLKVINPKKL
ncbi:MULTISPECIES: type II toxin-antitoxin system VapC family toxin [Dyadobacter]|uniref:Type II toxin-antitoxin system VapC family toxin n=1 Tax=Dyadobacter chenhuakuii TaxID=2909339 RepID=A0ABY4XJD1_9BACT|nr:MULTISPECIES: type II toxin-antitoxin system VapC family toxin [Dyadobacter]MCF2496428.1 type II toxin-antitoxin system VapC family toxin [Dyadobacter chenhuakuii]MCF2519405.1 type II toxin-antitoxin system VapC family toxin [Dyadobacter sp. CY351]USJ30485.1 type II toxin-antitoxin system VapC family toxin [Dyadobacter chenhuakuii]